MNRARYKKGFTLVEMVVAVGLFTIILFISTSAFLSIVIADRKSRAVRVATDNLNLTLEDMQRRIRTGSTYYCGTGGETGGVQDCTVAGLPGSTISFTEQDGTRVTYVWNTTTKAINRTIGSGVPIRVTAPEISIEGLKFFVTGSAPGVGGAGTDTMQPYVIIVVDGTVGVTATNPATKSSFKIQTTVTQRNYDN